MVVRYKMKKKNSSIELLRIFSMLLIITLHFTGHGVDVTNFDNFSLKYYIGWLMRGVAYISVNCYVLVTGYLLCMSKFNIKRLFSIILETLFYSVIIYLLLVLTQKEIFSAFSLLKCFIPILSGEYWFVTIYFGLYLLSPFLNFTIKNMSQKQHFYLIVLLFFLFSAIPTFFFFSKWLNYGDGYGIVWFIVLYYVSSYIRKYVDINSLRKYKRKILLITLFLWVAPLISKLLIAVITLLLKGRTIGSSLFYNNISIIIFLSSISTFLMFLLIEIKNNYIENIVFFLGKCTFGVYLIHDNNYIRPILWNYVSKYVGKTSGTYLISSFVIILLIFFSCALIDSIRNLLFKLLKKIPLFINTNDKISNYVNNFIENNIY